LREIDFGDFEGRLYDEIATSHPEIYRRWMETPTLVEFPGGESYTVLRLRVLAALESIRARHTDETAAIVSHGGVVRAILADCLQMRDEAIFRLAQGYGLVSIVEWLESTPLVSLLNAPAEAVGR
jgi:alpha-ribazole phosphatase